MTPTPTEVLSCEMQANDASADTIRDYLVALLVTLWEEGEGFSGKRPLGNSGWEYELYEALGRAGLVDIVFDDDYIDYVDSDTADKLILDAIKELR